MEKTMNTIRFILYVLMLAVSVSDCQSMQPKSTEQVVKPLLPVPGEKSIKGYELYSWQEESQWYFSVLIGTNREKTLEEIQAPDAKLKGIEELKPLLESIPVGEYMTWWQRESLAFPPEGMRKQVQEICYKQGIELEIAK
jgi:hypothetical protein